MTNIYDDRPDKGLFEYGTPFDDLDPALIDPTLKKITSPDFTLHMSGKVDNDNTIVIIPGGSGKLFTMLDGERKGLIFPSNLFNYFSRDINVVMVNLPHQLPWSWTKTSVRRQSRYIDELKAVKRNAPSANDDLVKLINCFVAINDIIDLARQTFPSSRIWLSGHCTGCNMIAKFSDSVANPNDYFGMIFMNPRRSDSDDYFRHKVDKPLLVLQHRDDPSPNSARHKPIDAKHYLSQGEYREVSGGSNYGYHSYSLGFHGFRDIESQVTQEIETFVKKFHK